MIFVYYNGIPHILDMRRGASIYIKMQEEEILPGSEETVEILQWAEMLLGVMFKKEKIYIVHIELLHCTFSEVSIPTAYKK